VLRQSGSSVHWSARVAASCSGCGRSRRSLQLGRQSWPRFPRSGPPRGSAATMESIDVLAEECEISRTPVTQGCAPQRRYHRTLRESSATARIGTTQNVQNLVATFHVTEEGCRGRLPARCWAGSKFSSVSNSVSSGRRRPSTAGAGNSFPACLDRPAGQAQVDGGLAADQFLGLRPGASATGQQRVLRPRRTLLSSA